MSEQVKERRPYDDIWEDLQALKMDCLCVHQDYKKADRISEIQNRIMEAACIPNPELDKLITSFHISLYKKG